MPFKLLVVDDEPAITNLLKSMLASLGCDVLTAQDSRVAAEMVAKRKFDGVILDARMPYMDGFQLAAAIRASRSNRGVPMVMITGIDDVETMRKAFKAGITLFLTKPITQERLTHAVNALRGAFLREKRRYSRLVYLDDVECTVLGQNSAARKVRGLDLSESGMALMRAQALPVGQKVNLKFRLPASKVVLELNATVVRCMPPDGIAVCFDHVSAETRTALQHYIGSNVS